MFFRDIKVSPATLMIDFVFSVVAKPTLARLLQSLDKPERAKGFLVALIRRNVR